jgi:hypothetical protein
MSVHLRFVAASLFNTSSCKLDLIVSLTNPKYSFFSWACGTISVREKRRKEKKVIKESKVKKENKKE